MTPTRTRGTQREGNDDLVAFLNHGHLPFAGRADELGRIDRFRQEIVESWGCRTLLFTGEAGSGKSRLVDRAIEIAEQQEASGIILRLRFRPSSITDLFSLVAGALDAAPVARRLLPLRPEPNPDAITRAVTRLCRLRPTLLFLEDLHLAVEPEVVRDIGGFLEGLRDDPIGIVATARPAAIPSRPLLTPTMIDEIPLGRLDAVAIDEITRQLFGGPGSEEAVDLLAEATQGNPLALRSALRRAVGVEAITVVDDHWGTADHFRQVVTTSADDVAEGLLAGLAPEDRQVATLLAMLGEVFAIESARLLVDDPETIERLRFRGIIGRTTIAAGRLSGATPSAEPLLGFTHTLLHDRLVRDVTTLPSNLARIVIDDLPIATILPYELLSDPPGNLDLSTTPLEAIATSVDRIVTDVIDIDHTADWRFGMTMLAAAESLLRRRIEAEADIDRQTILGPLAAIFETRLRLMRRDARSDDYRIILDRYDELTREVVTEEDAMRRMSLSVGRFFWLCESITGPDRRERMPAAHAGIRKLLAEIDELILRFPATGESRPYAQILGIWIAWTAAHGENREETMQEIRRRFDEIIADEAVPPMTRLRLRVRSLPEFLDQLNEEGRQARIVEAAAIEAEGSIPPPLLPFLGEMRRQFFHRTADYRALLPIHLRMRRFYSESGENPIAFGYDAEIAAARILLGAEPTSIVSPFLHYLATTEGVSPHYRTSGLRELLFALLLVGNRSELAAVADELPERPGGNEGRTDLIDRLVLQRLGKEKNTSEEVADLQRGPDTGSSVVRHAPLQELLDLADAKSTAEKEKIVLRLLDWYEVRGLRAAMQGLLAEESELFDAKRRREIERRIAAIVIDKALIEQEEEGPDHDTPFRMQAFGTIAILRPDGERFNPRGERLKLLLGTMIADRMLGRRLEREEFLQIVTGLSDEPKRRRDMTNMAISRLRAGLDEPEAILYDGETPRLNPELVSVDLLDAVDRVATARSALADDALLRAAPALSEGMDLWSGEVPFPGLYDDLFEGLRSRFEADLREMTITCTDRLTRAGDAAAAAGLLRKLAEAMPGDDEITEQLAAALRADNRPAEATRYEGE